MDKGEGTLKYWEKSTLSYLDSCRDTDPGKKGYHHNIHYISRPMLKEDAAGVPFYRRLFDQVKDQASKWFDIKENWSISFEEDDPEYDEEDWKYDSKISETGLLPESYVKKHMDDENRVYFASVDLRLYPKFKYKSQTELDIEALRSELEALKLEVAALKGLITHKPQSD